MAQAKVYQIDRLKTKVRNSFEFHRSTLEAQRRMEQAEFVNSKIPNGIWNCFFSFLEFGI